jgi:hypothetical protein
MKKRFLQPLCLALLGLSPLDDAALIDHGNALIYDTDLDITWYAYPNYDTATYDGYLAWVNGLEAGGGTNWRLPTTTATGTGEMGHLYYEELGNAPGSFSNEGPFANYGGLAANYGGFYTSTPVGDGNLYWFSFDGYGASAGSQSVVNPAYYYFWIHGLAVHDGSIGAPVPLPAGVFLLAPALAGLAALGSRARNRPTAAHAGR